MTVQAEPDRRRTRWDDHRRTRREQLVDAALRAIRTHGAGVGMDEVAAAADTSKAAVYRYFADRSELHLAVCTRASEQLVGQVTAALADEDEPRRQLAAGIDAYLRVLEADPEVYRFVHARRVTVIGAQVAQLIAERLAADGLDGSAAGPWGYGIVGLVESAADHWLAEPQTMSREALRDHLTDLAWSGLAGILASAGRPVDTTPPTWRPA